MKKYDLNNFIERKVGDKILIIDILQNAIYEVDESAALCIDLIKKKEGEIDYIFLSKNMGKNIETLKIEVPMLLSVLLGGECE